VSARRVKERFTQIHVSVPVRTLEQFDATLGFRDSRSKKLSHLMDAFAQDEEMLRESFSTRQLIGILMEKFEPFTPERVILESLLQILSK